MCERSERVSRGRGWKTGCVLRRRLIKPSHKKVNASEKVLGLVQSAYSTLSGGPKGSLNRGSVSYFTVHLSELRANRAPAPLSYRAGFTFRH